MHRARRTALAVVLVASLALNIVVAGFVAERLLDGRSGAERAATRAANAVLGRLPDDVRQPLLEAILMRRDDIETAIRDVRRSRRDVRDAMRAEPLDLARLRTALDRTRTQSDVLLSIIDDEIAQKLPEISAVDRAKIRVGGPGG